MLLMMAVMNMKLMLISTLCTPMGMPTRKMVPVVLPSKRMSCLPKAKDMPLRMRKIRLKTKLSPCADAVAMATPVTPSPSTPVSSTSPTMLMPQATATKISGLLLSPIARSRAQTML